MSPRVTDHTGAEVQPDPTPQGGTLTQPANVAMDEPGANVTNPLGEETIRCRVVDGAEFYAQFAGGKLVKAGEEYDVPISMARAGSQYLADISSGEPKAIPHEQQRVGQIPRADLAGRPRHERVGELENEIKALDERRAQVQKQLDHERAQLDAQIQKQQPQQPAQPQPAAPGGSVPAAPVGTGTPDPSTTNVEKPRPGEPATPTPRGA